MDGKGLLEGNETCPLQEGLPARADLAAHKGDPMESPKIGVAVRRERVHPVRDPCAMWRPPFRRRVVGACQRGKTFGKSPETHPSSFLVSRLSLNPAFLLLFLRVITGQKVITRWKVVHWR